MGLTRRHLLGSLLLPLSGCFVPARSPPQVWQPRYPLGPIPRRGGPGLLVGAAKVEITPPEGAHVYMGGYGFQRPMRRVRDPIYARALFFDDGVHRVALAMADVVGLLNPSVRRIRRLVGNGVQVAVASTHNHQSPDTMGYWGPALLGALPIRTGMDPAYQRVFERRMAAAVARAAESARPARLGFARGRLPDGLVRNLRQPGLLDPEITVLEARGEDGAAIALWSCFACHPETLGDRAHSLSADFPGVLCARLEEQRGGVAVFSNGALGGMVTPQLDDDAGERERAQVLTHLGLAAAEATLSALGTVEAVPVQRVRFHRRPVQLPSDNALFAYVQRVGLIEPRGAALESEVGRIDLGPLSMALVPGEPTPTVGLRIKEALRARGVRYPAVIGLAADELGYILDPAQYDDPEFGYEVTVSVGRETAPRIEAALAALPAP